MTKLGRFAPYVNEAEMRSLYPLPAGMQSECKGYRPDGTELDAFSGSKFNKIRGEVVSMTNKSVARFRAPYHNKDHFREVEKNGLAAAKAYGKLPEFVQQLFGIALYAHDLGHCASTFRVDAPRGLYRSGLGTQRTSEWVSAFALEEYMKKQGVCLPGRLFQTLVIWDSTYGGASRKGRSLGVPVPKPRTVCGWIMKSADACPASSTKERFRRSVVLKYREVPADPPPQTKEAFIESDFSFTRYVETCFKRLDGVAGGITSGLGWRGRLSNWRSDLEKLRDPRSKQSRILAEELERHNAPFR